MEEAHSSVEDHLHSSWCLLISTLLLAITAISCSVLRSVIRHKLSPTLPVLSILDFLCGLELCVCGQELGVILDIYGIPMYGVFLWIVCIWQATSWGEATANPASHVNLWWNGGQTAREAVTRTLAGALGGFSSLLVLAPLWALELSHLHQGRADRSRSGNCGEDLRVSPELGTTVELVGTLACCMSAIFLSNVASLKTRPLLTTSIDCAVAVFMVIAAFDLTGGYYNPTLAFGIKLGCGTNDTKQYLTHLAVYWVGPCIGTILAAPIYSSLSALRSRETKKEIKKKKE